MLSYKHAFHSGNHADVIKHLSLLAVLEKLAQKTKPFSVIDTHAGAGAYALDDAQVEQNKEYQTGVALINAATQHHGLLQRYQALLITAAEQGVYPGSPWLAASQLRDNDQLTLMELHPSEYQKLKRQRFLRNANIHNRDGFEGLLATTPPQIKRGVVLIDPPYEQLSEYEQVNSSVGKLLRRWANACVLVWYPMLTKRAGQKAKASEQMQAALAQLECASAFNLQLEVSDPTSDVGMYGSGMLIINPPWQLFESIEAVLPDLSHQLGATKTTLDWLVHAE
ncbi:23S rRNA (adenine(2030)-N(6))-methyltransferase RlmJ [Alteromonas sp. ASW11-36]|uniref:Ribosomal RNA large subunit methyltransferase J n=1 Tax=Alteromonas arenosi TaxID=3055817 RepID=A0ABT7SXH5_9ALTE|nr:23S rRNA (adenine(2030)-N(6))-methyltransferase RlmJ [Alteromonas sp. ASW11-36]MDM7860893.1 23S rRNA (adenine(2030)-N(6))-methyltransferase RlmJ [Alteromonas sp. ASW11-36]